MGAVDDHSARVRQGLLRARRDGHALGGYRRRTEARNHKAHDVALLKALAFGAVLEAGRGKTLAELSRDLFSAGCRNRSGGRLTPEMVRRLRARFEEGKTAFAVGALQDLAWHWDPLGLVCETACWRDGYLFRWSLRMTRKQYGEGVTQLLIERLRRVEDADWVDANLV